MTEEKWDKIIGNVKDNFEVKNEGKDHIDDEGGVDIKFIEFDGPLGHMRLEFVIKPVVLDKKTTYSRRIGSDTDIEYVYSETEKNSSLNAYKWDDGSNDWVEIESKNFE